MAIPTHNSVQLHLRPYVQTRAKRKLGTPRGTGTGECDPPQLSTFQDSGSGKQWFIPPASIRMLILDLSDLECWELTRLC